MPRPTFIPRAALLIVAASLAIAASGCAIDKPRAAEPTRTPPPRDAALAAQGWRIAWWDEFDGDSLETDRWDVMDDSTFGEGNLEEACLMADNVAVSDGHLVITAEREAVPVTCGGNDERFPQGRSYTSGFVQTRDEQSFTHGRFEIRARTPTQSGTSQGLWPAFWMRPVDREEGELDVLEMIGTGPGTTDGDRAVTQTIHFDYDGTHPQEASTYRLSAGTFSATFHEFAVEWEPGAIRWYVDDVLTYERTAETTPWLPDAFDRDQPFFLRLNLAVGGRWPGSPLPETVFPASYTIDYVRVYQR